MATESPSNTICCDAWNSTIKKYGTTVEQYLCVPKICCAFFPKPIRTQGKLKGRQYRNTWRFQEGDAVNEAPCAPFGPSRKTRPSPSSKHHKHNILGFEFALIQPKKEDHTHGLSPSFFVPPVSDRRRSKTTRQWDWPQCPQDEILPNRLSQWFSSRRGGTTSNLVSQRLSAHLQWSQSLQLRTNSRARWKLSLANNFGKGEDQNLRSQSTFDGTDCPNICKKIPREWFNRRWLKQMTRHAQEHLSIKPTSKIPNGCQHCNDLTLPRNISGEGLHSTCEERPAPVRLVLQIQRCSSRVILPKLCSETKSEGASHWEWLTKHSTEWMNTRYVNVNEQVEILTKTSSRDDITSTLTRTANRANIAHGWYTSS